MIIRALLRYLTKRNCHTNDFLRFFRTLTNVCQTLAKITTVTDSFTEFKPWVFFVHPLVLNSRRSGDSWLLALLSSAARSATHSHLVQHRRREDSYYRDVTVRTAHESGDSGRARGSLSLPPSPLPDQNGQLRIFMISYLCKKNTIKLDKTFLKYKYQYLINI